jgi:hypothetical protein
MAKATNAIHPLHLYGPELTNRICLGAMSRRPKQLRRIRRQDYNGVSDGKYKVSAISGETVKGEHVLQDKSRMLHAFDMTYGLDSILGHKYDPINGVAYRLAAAYGKRGQRVCHIPGK